MKTHFHHFYSQTKFGGGKKKRRVVNGVCRKNISRYERYHDGLWVFLFKRCDMLLLCYLFYDVFLLQDFSLTPSSGCTHLLFCLPLQHTLQRHSLCSTFCTYPPWHFWVPSRSASGYFTTRHFCDQHFLKLSFLLLSRS